MRDGYLATWQGREYEANPDGDQIRLYSIFPEEGFAKVRTGRYVRRVPAGEVAEFCYVRTACTWQGQPFIVLGEHEQWLRVEYTGGRAPVAEELNLEEFDHGVYQGWVPLAQVSDLGEFRV